MKQYKKFAALLTAVTTGLVVLNSFPSQAADAQAVQLRSGVNDRGESSTTSVQEIAPQEVFQDTKVTVLNVLEQYQEKKKKEEEERLEAEVAQREKEEAEAAALAAAEAEIQQNVMQATEEEARLLASIIFCEAGNQPYEGQVAVGAVVINRVRSAVYPNSIAEVIYQSGQFGPAMSGWLDSVYAGGSYTDTAMQAATDALAGSNPIGECLYFGCGNYGMQIGDHFFH